MMDKNTTAQNILNNTTNFELNSLLSSKIFQNIPGILFFFDINSNKIIYTNYSAEVFLGYPTEDFLNNGFEIGKQILNDADQKLLKDVIAKLKDSADNTSIPIEVQLKHKEGYYLPFELRLEVFKRDEEDRAFQIIGLMQRIDHISKIKSSVSESELSYKDLFNTIKDAIFIHDESGVIIEVNKSAESITGYSREELIGQTEALISAPGKNDPEHIKQRFKEALKGNQQVFEFWSRRKDGSIILKDIRIYHGVFLNKKVLIVHAQDVTKRKIEEEKIQAALAEKNVLLREVHHRVKNNLQAMIYLIEMQIEKITDKKVQTFLKELQEQARTMSLVYEQLYQSDYLAKVDMDSYLHMLASNVIQAFGSDKDINLSIKTNNVVLNVETAMPCGLVINELLTNSLKYAFPKNFNKKPSIDILLKNESKKITISVSDNGIGLPLNLDWENTDSNGLMLVNFWVKYQLAGSIKLEQQNGTNYIISFNYED